MIKQTLWGERGCIRIILAAFFYVYLKGNVSAKVGLHSANLPFVADLEYRD